LQALPEASSSDPMTIKDVNSPTQKFSHELSLFWKSLSTLQVEEDFLQFSARHYLLPSHLSHLYVRQCYVDLFEIIENNVALKLQRFALTGTPGVGKSAFLFYVLWRLASIQENETVILHRACDGNRVFVFTKTNCYNTFGLERVIHMLDDPTTWYLTDTLAPPPGQYLATTILVASPDRRHYSEFLKHTLGVHLHFLPVWTLDELLTLGKKYSLSEDVVQERFQKIGGIPRFIQSKWDLNTIIDDALSRVNIQRLSHITCQELCSEKGMWHIIAHLHLVEVKEESVIYTRAFPQMASHYVTERALKKFIKSETQELTDFLNRLTPTSEVASLQGSLFEGLAHIKLAKGGTFKYRSLDKNITQVGTLNLTPLRTGHFFNVSECKDLETYFIPRNPQHACIDSYAPSVGFFQMTINLHHGIKDEPMKKILSSSKEERLYFVVPEHLFEAFPRQRWINPNGRILDDYDAKPSKRRRKNVYRKLKQFVILITTNMSQ
jgi:hypothetical protein